MRSDCLKATLGVILMICLLLGLVVLAVFIVREKNSTTANGHVALWGLKSTSTPTSEEITPSTINGQVSTTEQIGKSRC